MGIEKGAYTRARTSVFVLPIHPLINFWRQENSPKGERLFAEMLQPAFSGGSASFCGNLTFASKCNVVGLRCREPGCPRQDVALDALSDRARSS